MSSPDQRRKKRYQIDRPCSIKLPSGEALRARAINLSVLGIGVLSPKAIDHGTTVTLRLQLVNVGHGSSDLEVQARVVHSYLKDDEYGIGMEFGELGVKEQIALLDFADFRERLAASRNEAVPLHSLHQIGRK